MVKEIKTSNAEKCGEQSGERRGCEGEEPTAEREMQRVGRSGKELGSCS